MANADLPAIRYGGVMTSSLRGAPPPQPPPPDAGSKAGLTVSKVVAGAGAAATSAVAGSVFGADGTVVGAAVGSVVSAVAAAAYERSLDRTREVVSSRVRLPSGRTAEVTQVLPADLTQVIPAQQQRAASIRPATPIVPVRPPRRLRLPLLAGATALIFLVGLLAVTGVELLAGGPLLSSQHGTSVGRVLGYSTGSASPTSTAEASAATTASSATETSSPTTSRKAKSAATASGSAAVEGSAAPRTTSARVRDVAVPTAQNGAPGAP